MRVTGVKLFVDSGALDGKAFTEPYAIQAHNRGEVYQT